MQFIAGFIPNSTKPHLLYGLRQQTYPPDKKDCAATHYWVQTEDKDRPGDWSDVLGPRATIPALLDALRAQHVQKHKLLHDPYDAPVFFVVAAWLLRLRIPADHDAPHNQRPTTAAYYWNCDTGWGLHTEDATRFDTEAAADMLHTFRLFCGLPGLTVPDLSTYPVES